MRSYDKRRNIAPDRSRKGEARAARNNFGDDSGVMDMDALVNAERLRSLQQQRAHARDALMRAHTEGGKAPYYGVFHTAGSLMDIINGLSDEIRSISTFKSNKQKKQEQSQAAFKARMEAQTRREEERQRVKMYGSDYGCF